MLQERKQCSKLNQKSTGGAPLKGDIRPASSFSSPGDFDLSDWAYLAEGGAHVVFRYTGAAADLAGNVLKVRRDKHHPISWRLLVHFTAHVNELCRGSRDLHNVERTGGWESRQATPTAHGVERLKDISGRRARGGDNFPHRKEDHQRGEAEEDNNSAKDMEEQELPCKYAARAELGGAHKASDPTHEGATSCTSSCVSDKTVSSCSRPACGCSYCPACRLFFSSSGPRTRHRRLYGLISPMYLSCQRVILLPADVVDALLKLSRREAKKKREQGVCRESSTENRGLHSPPADDLPLDHDAEKKGVVQASVYTPHRSHRLGPPLQSAEGSESRLSCASSISSFSCSKSVGDDQAKGTSSGPSEPTDACPQGSLFSSTGTGVFSEGSVPCVLEEDFLSMPPAFSAVAIEKEVSRACSLRGAENPSIEAPQLPRENSEEDRTRLGCEVCRRLSGNIGIGTQSSARSTVSQLPSCDYYSVELKPKCGILEETQSTDDNESDSEAWQAGMKESGGPESSSLKRHLETRSREFATGRSPSRAADEAEGGALTEATAKLHKRERDVEEAMDVQLTEDFRVRGEGRESRSSGCLDEVRSTPPSLGGRKTERRKSRGSSQPKTSVHVSPIEGHHKFKIGKSLPSRFTMQQFAKLSMHKVSRLSLYDPTQFFQCTYAALSCQLRHLVENPQNNLSVFLNGSALPCQSLLRPLPRGASQEGTCGKAPPEEEDVGEPREPVLLVDILARVWEASRDLFEGILLLQAFAASQQRVAVRLARELRKVTGAQHDSLRRKHLAELEAYSKVGPTVQFFFTGVSAALLSLPDVLDASVPPLLSSRAHTLAVVCTRCPVAV